MKLKIIVAVAALLVAAPALKLMAASGSPAFLGASGTGLAFGSSSGGLKFSGQLFAGLTDWVASPPPCSDVAVGRVCRTDSPLVNCRFAGSLSAAQAQFVMRLKGPKGAIGQVGDIMRCEDFPVSFDFDGDGFDEQIDPCTATCVAADGSDLSHVEVEPGVFVDPNARRIDVEPPLLELQKAIFAIMTSDVADAFNLPPGTRFELKRLEDAAPDVAISNPDLTVDLATIADVELSEAN